MKAVPLAVFTALAQTAVLCASSRPPALQIPALFLPAGEGYVTWNSPVFVEAGSFGLRFNSAKAASIHFSFLGAHRGIAPQGIDPIGGAFHRIGAAGNVSSPAYRALLYRNIYDGVDFIVRFDGRQMKSEYHLAPGTSPARIRFRYQGTGSISIDGHGALRIPGSSGDIFDSAPEIYQDIGRSRKRIPGKFQIDRHGSVGFQIGAYNPSLPLTIDPVFSFTSEFNGNQSAVITAIAADAKGNVYATGYTPSTNFPLVAPFQASSGGGNDVFVLKLNQLGNTIEYATYFGGLADDRGFAIAIDSQGEAVVAGQTSSPNFPLYSPAQPVPGGGMDAFVAKLNAAGDAILFSTTLGGSASDAANAVAVDASGTIYVAGDTSSTNFPMLMPFQSQNRGGQDAFLAKLSSSGALLYSTYLGGNSADHASAIAVDASGNTSIAGSTYSTNFPTASPFQAQTGGGQDAFVTKFNPQGSALVFSTYLGGSGGAPASPESASGIGIDASGDVYVAGTTSSANFPVKSSLQGFHPYGTDVFLTKLAPGGSSLIFSTYLGGSSYDYANSLLVDQAGCAYIIGQTSSWDLPAVNAPQSSLAGLADAFLIKISADGTAMNFATYLGGSNMDAGNSVAVDHQGNLFSAGTTESNNFPQPSGITPQQVGVVTGFISNFWGTGDHAPMLIRFYRGFFNRGPDPVGLANWTSELDAGTSSAQVANDFFYSPEFYNTGVLIGAAFFAVQGRDPDFQDFENDMVQLRSGTLASPSCHDTELLCSQLTLINNFMSSAYYQSTYASLSRPQFVTAVYQNLLGQSPSASVLNNWVSQLNSGLTPAQFLQSVMNGSQYTSIITNRLLVDMCYFVFLGRNPDPAGYQTWLGNLNSGMSSVSLFGGFVFSTEFMQSL